MDMNIEEMIEKAVNIAKNGTQEEQEAFYEWACSSIKWLSYQGNSEECGCVEKMYKAYLNAKGEEQSVQSLVEKSGKSKTVIYDLAKKLGRLPTLEEIGMRKKGRPSKYK